MIKYKEQILNNVELRNLQLKELDILKRVILVIESLNLTYYAVGGTALGAFKYGGFIPWDDDIDIAMPRSDYEQFIKKAETLLPNNLEMQSIYNDKKYCYGVTKIRDKNSSYFDFTNAKLKTSHGVFVDIFPIDYALKNNKKSFFFKARENKITWSTYNDSVKITFIDFIKSLFCRVILIFTNPHSCALKNEKFIVNNGDEKSLYFYMRIENHNKEFFGKPNKCKFEDTFINVPSMIEKYLFNAYGDIQIDPPLEKQKPHHKAILIDVNEPYCNYYFAKGKVVRK